LRSERRRGDEAARSWALARYVFAPSLGKPVLAGMFVAGYGIGNLVGSALLMVRPLRGDADRLTMVLGGAVAGTLLIVIIAPTTATTLAAFVLAGIANAMFFAATLAARSEYSPPTSRGQVFIWVGALKIAAGSAGTATAGALIGAITWLPVAVVATVTTAAVGGSALGRAHRTKDYC
jgi:hypothetical protein